MERILITGGAGFIGSNLAEKLINTSEFEVYILDIKENPINLNAFRGAIKYIQGDVRDREFIYKILTKHRFEGIIHLAAISRVIWCEEDPELCISTNIYGTQNILDGISRLNKKPWIIFGSSREVYGEQQILPVKENARKVPINIYGQAKVKGEEMVCEYSSKFEFSSLIFRFSNVYGNERDILDRLIPKFILRALQGNTLEINGGAQIFDFTHIEDTVKALELGMDYLENQNGEILCEDFHILTGSPTRIIDIPKIISEHLGREITTVITKPRDYDVVKFYGDPAKARDIVNFKAEISLSEGIKLTIDRFKEVFT